MRLAPAWLLLACLLLCLINSPALAHGTHRTPDDADRGRSIQFYATPTLWQHSGFRAAVRELNSVPGPRLDRVRSRERAEVFAFMGPCRWDGKRVYGGTAKYRLSTPAKLCLSPRSRYGIVWPEHLLKVTALHELAHFYGMFHHDCADAPSVMSVCKEKFRKHLTRHDRRWKRGYAGYYRALRR